MAIQQKYIVVEGKTYAYLLVDGVIAHGTEKGVFGPRIRVLCSRPRPTKRPTPDCYLKAGSKTHTKVLAAIKAA